ncbi:multidrug export protein MepA [Oxobacter pfennigii]|uniref:Multidrug export protein MepA n=1 Tax=Oxobacter pfennigii TaxID=36849 RepID=A0A0P8WL76_9CLOT|nr:MATE family efflux transporter [Oxobacter pfennigii]KPU43143.1 multidrug export protein MepA [Oxobacter pfennigii]
MTESRKIDAKQDRTYILGSMPVSKAIWTLAIPTMVAMLIQVVYNMTDTFFIGKLNNPNMVAAIALSMPIFMISQAFGNIFAIGGASFISRMLGKGDRERASEAGSIAFWSALGVSTLVSLIAFIFAEPILIFCGASPNTLQFGKDYLIYMLLGSPFIGMQMALSGLLRSEGATKVSMNGMVIGSILNIILDPIFILGMDLGVAGAALATVIGNVFGFAYNVSFYVRKKGIISISPKNFGFKKDIYAEIFKIGIPASVGMILMSLGFGVSNAFAAGFGDNVVAANGVVMRVTNITVMLTMGLAQGCQPLLGFSYGAKNFKRLVDTIKNAITIGTVMNVAFAIIFYIFADKWISVFINDADVINLGARIIKSRAIVNPIIATQMVLMTSFQALGKSVQSLIISLGRQGLFFIPAIVIFSNVWGLDGFIYALPVADLLTTTLSVILFLFMRKSLHDTSSEMKERVVA